MRKTLIFFEKRRFFYINSTYINIRFINIVSIIESSGIPPDILRSVVFRLFYRELFIYSLFNSRSISSIDGNEDL